MLWPLGYHGPKYLCIDRWSRGDLVVIARNSRAKGPRFDARHYQRPIDCMHCMRSLYKGVLKVLWLFVAVTLGIDLLRNLSFSSETYLNWGGGDVGCCRLLGLYRTPLPEKSEFQLPGCSLMEAPAPHLPFEHASTTTTTYR